MRETCGILIPFFEVMYMREGDDFPPCLLPEHHQGDHLMLTSDGRYIAWAFDEEYCGDKDTCVCLLDYGPVECFSGYEVDRAEAERLMKKGLAE